ncbi:MAG: membrane-bound lytic murein transglycosylase B [Limisphaerales bacterium]|jgi:membrane-bound lytic murein transglycosylase B
MLKLTIFLALSLLAAGMPLNAAPLAASNPADFDACLAELKVQISNEVGTGKELDRMLEAIEEIPRVITLDRSQPEFTQSFTQYYQVRVTQARIDKGRALKRQHAGLFQQIKDDYGVPAHYLLALWGLETNFGGYLGKLSVPSALATLACDGRRKKFFQGEFLALSRIVATGGMRPEELQGSWAGAIGHMQFMPSTFLAHAIDYNKDGAINVYKSLPDALGSAANYLHQMDWQAGFRWGREVHLPTNFDYAQASYDNWQPLSHWHNLGVTDSTGARLADLDLSAALLLPMGSQGPAFVIYPNFKALMRWNRSSNYALSVGRLADRIAGLGQLTTPLPDAKESRFRTADIERLQLELTALGFDTTGADGVIGPATRNAIRAFQQHHELPADGYPSSAVWQLLESQ